MASRDSQTVILSRQAILLVTAVGVGLLTLCYVLGVQVGKQSAALRHPQAKGSGEDLQELPASVADQIKAFQPTGVDLEKPPQAAVPKPEGAKPATPKADNPDVDGPKAEVPAPPPKPEAKAVPEKKPAPEKKPEGASHWNLQLVSTPDSSEAQRMAARARNAGFPTVTVSEKGLFKVRLTQTGSRDTMDATALKLKSRGYKPFAIRTP